MHLYVQEWLAQADKPALMRLSNIGWNFCGLGGALIVAAFAIPPLIRSIGLERFGLLSLAWGLIGFAGIFDLGVGRATTQTIARLRGSDQLEQVPAVLKTAATLSFITGLGGTVLLAIAVLAGAHTHIKYAAALDSEVTVAAYLLALTIPIQSMSAMFRGVNEAFENFREISLVRLGLGVANFVGPLLVAKYTTHLAALVGTLLISRLVAFFLFRRFAAACNRRFLVGAESSAEEVSSAIARNLLSFGGWFTVSSLVSPMLVQGDRFVIGALISATAVAAYTIPYEVVTQSLTIVGAISGVAFPSLSALVHSRPDDVEKTFHRWLCRVAILMLVVVSVIGLLLPIALPWWIGSKLPDESVRIGQILCVGVFCNALGAMYFALLHAHGRTDITAKIHLLELPIFLLFLYFSIGKFGVIGAAFAWLGRMGLDLCLLSLACRKLIRPIAFP